MTKSELSSRLANNCPKTGSLLQLSLVLASSTSYIITPPKNPFHQSLLKNHPNLLFFILSLSLSLNSSICYFFDHTATFSLSLTCIPCSVPPLRLHDLPSNFTMTLEEDGWVRHACIENDLPPFVSPSSARAFAASRAI